MKNINNLLSEVQELNSLEELESAVNLFTYGVDNDYYTSKDVYNFYNVYNPIVDKAIAKEISNKLNSNYLKTLAYVQNYKMTKDIDNLSEIEKFVVNEFDRVNKVTSKYKVKDKLN